jgi:hypothetical protein
VTEAIVRNKYSVTVTVTVTVLAAGAMNRDRDSLAHLEQALRHDSCHGNNPLAASRIDTILYRLQGAMWTNELVNSLAHMCSHVTAALVVHIPPGYVAKTNIP